MDATSRHRIRFRLGAGSATKLASGDLAEIVPGQPPRLVGRDRPKPARHPPFVGSSSTAVTAVGAEPAVAGTDRGPARQIERIFRYTHILARAFRNEMIGNGRGEEVEELIRSARALLAELQNAPSD